MARCRQLAIADLAYHRRRARPTAARAERLRRRSARTRTAARAARRDAVSERRSSARRRRSCTRSEPALLDIERRSRRSGRRARPARPRAVGRDVDVRGDPVRAVTARCARRCTGTDAARVVDEALAVVGEVRPSRRSALRRAVERQHVVSPGLRPPGAISSTQLLRYSLGQVVALREVLGDVVQLPAVGIELGRASRRSRRRRTLMPPRRNGPGYGNRLPAAW